MQTPSKAHSLDRHPGMLTAHDIRLQSSSMQTLTIHSLKNRRSWSWVALLLITSLGFSLGCASPRRHLTPTTRSVGWSWLEPWALQSRPSAATRIKEARLLPENVHFLDFDPSGRLVDPKEAVAIADSIAQRAQKHTNRHSIVIMSLGWNHSRDKIMDEYHALLKDYLTYKFMSSHAQAGKDIDDTIAAERRRFSNQVDVIAISWDSAQGALRRTMNDMLPTPSFNCRVAFIPDQVLLPFSFWAKASLADSIGYGDLRSAVTSIIDKAVCGKSPSSMPAVYLVGHSFGCRIVSGIVNENISIPLRDLPPHPFTHANLVEGIVLVQPAMAALTFPSRSKGVDGYTIAVTQSRHDYANGVLFPVGNTLLNSHFSTFNTSLAAALGSKAMPGRQLELGPVGQAYTFVGSLYGTGIYAPLSYGYNQVFQIFHRNVQYPLDTLSQVPIVEIPINECGSLMQRGDPGKQEAWGSSHRGAFGFGIISESAGRAMTPRLTSFSTPQATPLQEAIDDRFEFRRGETQFIEASKTISHSFFLRRDLNKPWIRLLGRLDPIGAHADYRKPEVYKLIHKVLSRHVSVRPEVSALSPQHPALLPPIQSTSESK